MVAEASGGAWSADARVVLYAFAKASARLSGEKASVLAERFTQSLSVSLHRANVRSILRRASAGAPIDPALAAARAVLDAAAAENAAANH